MHKDFPMHIQQIKFYDICLLPCCVCSTPPIPQPTPTPTPHHPNAHVADVEAAEKRFHALATSSDGA